MQFKNYLKCPWSQVVDTSVDRWILIHPWLNTFLQKVKRAGRELSDELQDHPKNRGYSPGKKKQTKKLLEEKDAP